jgi:hypothetical protein
VLSYPVDPDWVDLMSGYFENLKDDAYNIPSTLIGKSFLFLFLNYSRFFKKRTLKQFLFAGQPYHCKYWGEHLRESFLKQR